MRQGRESAQFIVTVKREVLGSKSAWQGHRHGPVGAALAGHDRLRRGVLPGRGFANDRRRVPA
jgi:hypothetical protein